MTVFREMEPQDYNFILSNWAHSFKGSPWAGCSPNNLWHSRIKEEVDQLLGRGAHVVMAVADDDRDHLLGFICFEKPACGIPVIHYAYVKDDFREQGVGSALMDIAGKGQHIYTYRTYDSQYIAKGGIHVPAIARRKDLEPVYVSDGRRSKF
jgi:GNAT superfamily N-acetyltransferase